MSIIQYNYDHLSFINHFFHVFPVRYVFHKQMGVLMLSQASAMVRDVHQSMWIEINHWLTHDVGIPIVDGWL